MDGKINVIEYKDNIKIKEEDSNNIITNDKSQNGIIQIEINEDKKNNNSNTNTKNGGDDINIVNENSNKKNGKEDIDKQIKNSNSKNINNKRNINDKNKIIKEDLVNKNIELINSNEINKDISSNINSNINSNNLNSEESEIIIFNEENFNEFTFILLTNFEAKKINLDEAKEKNNIKFIRNK